ncbi:MAG: type II toxin-antitoxin system RelE/ParE family toxin [Candidatus Omnitrophica bacterium]|nr:type II toxin-antitoxin system RelE/ParE family toxin [Candidatus Omnitrophota bacterium]
MRERRYDIFFTRTSQKEFILLPEDVRREITLVLDEIALDPLRGKPLHGHLKGLYSERAGKYRIIYKLEKNELIIVIVSVGHRRDVYNIRKV